MNKINNSINPFRLFSDSNKSPKRTRFFNELKENGAKLDPITAQCGVGRTARAT